MENGTKKEGSVNATNLEVGMMSSNANVLGAEIDSEVPEELGWPKRRRIPR